MFALKFVSGLGGIDMFFKGGSSSYMLLMVMNCFTFICVISLVTYLILSRCNDRWNIFKSLDFLTCYKESAFTFLLNDFHGSSEVHIEVFDTWNMSAIKEIR